MVSEKCIPEYPVWSAKPMADLGRLQWVLLSRHHHISDLDRRDIKQVERMEGQLISEEA